MNSPDTTSVDEGTVVQEMSISYDGIMSWDDVYIVSGKPSRSTVWRWEREGKFPARVQVGPGRIGWVGREIQAHNEALPRVGLVESEEAAE